MTGLPYTPLPPPQQQPWCVRCRSRCGAAQGTSGGSAQEAGKGRGRGRGSECVTAFRSTRSNRSTGQAHQPAAGACRPSIRAGPGPTGSFHQQPRYSVRGGAGGGWGGGRGCSRWSQFALCSDSTPTGSHLRWVLCPLHPDRAKWDDECPATHTHAPTHPYPDNTQWWEHTRTMVPRTCGFGASFAKI